MDKESRKKAMQAYKDMEVIGGIFRIVNTQSGWKSEYMSTPNMRAQKNRLNSAMGMHTNDFRIPEEQRKAYDGTAFAIEEITLLKKKPDQSASEFQEDLSALLDLYRQQ